MAELLIPADAENEAVNELEASFLLLDGFTTVDVGTRLPGTLDGDFVRVVAVGGTEANMVTDSLRIALEGFSKREVRARDLAATSLGIVLRAARNGRLGDVICHDAQAVSLPANLPLPSLPGWYRYIATASVDLRRSRV